jgi:hypothetical protein
MTRKKKPKSRTVRRNSRQQPYHALYMEDIVQPRLHAAIRNLKDNRQPLNVTTLAKELATTCEEAVQVTRVRQWLSYFDLTPSTLPYWEPEAAKVSAAPKPKGPFQPVRPQAPLQPLRPEARKISPAEDNARALALETQEISDEVRATLNASMPGAGPVNVPMPGGQGIMGSLDDIRQQSQMGGV